MRDNYDMAASDHRVTYIGIRHKAAMREWLAPERYSHFVTLNFHSEYSAEAARRKLSLWAKDVAARLFSSAEFTGQPTSRLFRFVAFPELTLQDEPHWHLAVDVTESRRSYFERFAPFRWKHIVPSGTIDVQVIRSTDSDHRSVLGYITKRADRPCSYAEFVTSNMILPATWAPCRARHST